MAQQIPSNLGSSDAILTMLETITVVVLINMCIYIGSLDHFRTILES